MPRHYRVFLLLLAGFILGCTVPGRAQDLPPRVLEQSLVINRLQVDSVAALLTTTDWLFHDGEIPYWTCRKAGKDQARVELRHTNRQTYYDLVYKTMHHASMARLRTALRRQRSLSIEYVNCPQCWGERLVGYGYTITLINQKASFDAKRVTFPYVLVMRRTTPESPENNDNINALSQILGEH